MTFRSEDLSEYPESLRDETIPPWEESETSRVLWITGEPLGSFPSSVLLSHRRLLVKKNGERGHYFDDLIQAIDDVLTERGGE